MSPNRHAETTLDVIAFPAREMEGRRFGSGGSLRRPTVLPLDHFDISGIRDRGFANPTVYAMRCS